MLFGVQRRGVYVVPPAGDDLEWLSGKLDLPDARSTVARGYGTGRLIAGIIRRAATRKRIGYIVVFPPSQHDFWEMTYAIPNAADRDAYSALNASDAMLHYLFDHHHIPALGWRVRDDNAASNAIIRRIGYVPYEQVSEEGHNFALYRLDPPAWAARRARLERGEAAHPSGIGATFVVLEPPCVPLLGDDDDD